MIIAGSIWLFTMTSGMPLIPSIILTVVGGSVAAGLLFLLPVTTAAVSVVGALGIGYTVARSGEELILGKRRRYV